ncbi:hypothetical protein GH714_040612 [Hevea brasiliensis]|uniref:RRM domain-containing protein n=1 Tax=Hevea brasiliensis TaxID=3981 RepID=A0A6A6L0L9_HEVBR|nr:hypothetical protein GH714_040612 [Hevea brasiliensis]
MGGILSKRASPRQASTSYSRSYPQSSYIQPNEELMPYQLYTPATPSYGSQAPDSERRLDRKYLKIDDNYHSLEQSSNLIVGIDFTKSNEWTGARSFNRRSLHHIGDDQNPFEQAISIIGKTLSCFDEDNLIPCFGFGEASTHDQEVFSSYPDESFCNGFEEVLRRYRESVPHVRLSGPTSFLTIIEMAITIVKQSGGQYHVLVIIADGQVTRSVDTQYGQLSPQEKELLKQFEYPLSIILVGVGDGPWDMMKEFEDNIPARAFDNFQFVNFTEIMSMNMDRYRKEAEFSLAALMEIPSQYKATLELNILGSTRGKAVDRVPNPPPQYGAASFSNSKPSRSSSFHSNAPSSCRHDRASTAPPVKLASDNHEIIFSVLSYLKIFNSTSDTIFRLANHQHPIAWTRPLQAQTSDWAQREEEGDTTITLTESEQEEPTWENQASVVPEAQVSDWEADGEDAAVEAVESDGEGAKEGVLRNRKQIRALWSHLRMRRFLWEICLMMLIVIYNRETDSSRGFGFVTMSTVEEAEQAVETFHRYDLNGRLLTVNKAAPRGSRPERPPRVYESAYRIYVGNLPWDVDDAHLEQVFSEHGKVVDARVVYDRETGRSRGFGFVTMSTETELNDAIAALDGRSLDGRAIRVNVAEQRPRRNSF